MRWEKDMVISWVSREGWQEGFSCTWRLSFCTVPREEVTGNWSVNRLYGGISHSGGCSSNSVWDVPGEGGDGPTGEALHFPDSPPSPPSPIVVNFGSWPKEQVAGYRRLKWCSWDWGVTWEELRVEPLLLHICIGQSLDASLRGAPDMSGWEERPWRAKRRWRHYVLEPAAFNSLACVYFGFYGNVAKELVWK